MYILVCIHKIRNPNVLHPIIRYGIRAANVAKTRFDELRYRD